MEPYFSFQWHITDDCDQRCRHCYIFSECEHKHLDSMTWEQMEDVFWNCLDFCEVHGRRPYFFLTGGDPILHPEFWRLLELASGHSVPFTIMGNPFHLDDESCARMRELGCRTYQLSLDGLEETHDWFRKPGSYASTLDAIGVIRRAGMRASVMTTVSAANIDEVTGIIDVVAEHGADLYAFARYCPTSSEREVGISPARYRRLLAECDERFRHWEEAGCRTTFVRKDHLWTLFDFEEGRFEVPGDAVEGIVYGGCNCGNSHLTILPTGDVLACRRVAESRVGNALRDRLADVWVGEMERYRDYAAFEKCARCELLAWCRGCPAVAAGSAGSAGSGCGFYAADPQCWRDVA